MIKDGTILLVLTSEEADIIIDGLDEIIYGEKSYFTTETVIKAVNLADYIEERLNEVTSYDVK